MVALLTVRKAARGFQPAQMTKQTQPFASLYCDSQDVAGVIWMKHKPEVGLLLSSSRKSVSSLPFSMRRDVLQIGVNIFRMSMVASS